MNPKTYILTIIICALMGCRTYKIEDKPKCIISNIDTLKSHLDQVSTKSEPYQLFRDFYFANKKYKFDEYYLTHEQINAFKKAKLSKIKTGEIIGPIQQTNTTSILIKKQSTEILNCAKLRFLFVKNSKSGYIPQRDFTIDDIKEKIKQGEDFIELVKKYSEDYSLKGDGDYGWCTDIITRPEIVAATKNSKAGEIKYVETDLGLFITKVEQEWSEKELSKFIELKINGCD